MTLCFLLPFPDLHTKTDRTNKRYEKNKRDSNQLRSNAVDPSQVTLGVQVGLWGLPDASPATTEQKTHTSNKSKTLCVVGESVPFSFLAASPFVRPLHAIS